MGTVSNLMVALYHCLYVNLILTAIITGASTLSVQLSMKEELPINTVIGYLYRHLANVSMAPGKTAIVNENKRFIEVQGSGEVVLRKIIDRESICSTESLCCDTDECIIKTDIHIVDSNNGNAPKSVTLFINVTDINDCKPTFEKESQTVYISEAASVGTVLPLSLATDNDVTAANQISMYSLREETNTFHLQQSSDLLNIALMSVSPLDYERRSNYTAFLSACDPTDCATQTVHILVLDINDNQPTFDKLMYIVNVSEASGPYQALVQVVATDRDSGDNARIFYSLMGKHDQDLLRTFSLNSSTGIISLMDRELSVNIRNRYTLTVMAADHGQPRKHAARPAQVIIYVEDVNDHAPEITFIAPADGHVNVVENKEPHVICTMRIKDKDVGENGTFTCHLEQEQNYFHLYQQSKEIYAIKTTQTFDYEKQNTFLVTIVCKDFGTPSQQIVHSMTIGVLDVNEYAPIFDQQVYYVNVYENMKSGMRILQVKATDRDGEARLQYQMDDSTMPYFQINSSSGWIETASMPLDREKIERFAFTVFVFDAENEPRSASCTIEVLIEDDNDNTPIWQIMPRYTIKENLPRFTSLGQRLLAKDADSGENAQIRYSIVATWSGEKLLSNNYFRLDSESGEIQTLTSLDRESTSSFLLEIKASDGGKIPLSTLTNITVDVLDENDNAPRFIRPPVDDMIFNISLQRIKLGTIFYTVLTEDADEGENGRVNYYLEKLYDKFILNRSTGALIVRSPLDATSYNLYITATDCGFPSQSTKILLVLNVFGYDSSYVNFLVIIIMISMTTVVSLILLLAIACIRRSSHRSSSQSNSTSGCYTSSKDKSQRLFWNCHSASMDPMKSHSSNYNQRDKESIDSTPVLQTLVDQTPYYLQSGSNNLGNRLTLDLDHESGDSGRGGSEYDELALMQQLGVIDLNRFKAARGFGSLHRPHLANAMNPSYRMPSFGPTRFLPLNTRDSPVEHTIISSSHNLGSQSLLAINRSEEHLYTTMAPAGSSVSYAPAMTSQPGYPLHSSSSDIIPSQLHGDLNFTSNMSSHFIISPQEMQEMNGEDSIVYGPSSTNYTPYSVAISDSGSMSIFRPQIKNDTFSLRSNPNQFVVSQQNMDHIPSENLIFNQPSIHALSDLDR